MEISFKPLSKSHFRDMFRWLTSPHVKAWWDQNIHWTSELLKDKYCSYIEGYKVVNGEKKQISAFIICLNNNPIGYIQFYNAYDFPRSTPLLNLPKSLAAFDFFIGEKDILQHGIGSNALSLFLNTICSQRFHYTFADPDQDNVAAVKTYKRVGFKKISLQKSVNEVWMLRKNDLEMVVNSKFL